MSRKIDTGAVLHWTASLYNSIVSCQCVQASTLLRSSAGGCQSDSRQYVSSVSAAPGDEAWMTWGRVMMRCHSTRMDTPQLSSSVGAGYHGNWKPRTLNTCRNGAGSHWSAEVRLCKQSLVPVSSSAPRYGRHGTTVSCTAIHCCSKGCRCAASLTELHVTPNPMQRWNRESHPGAVVFRGRLVVGREDHDLVAGGAQPFDEALEAVLHTADVAEGARLLHQIR